MTMDNIWYHGTDSAFKEFKYNDDIGFHFGTLQQATTRLNDKQTTNKIIMKVNIELKNPIRIRDISNFTVDSIKYELEYNPLFADKLIELDSISTNDQLRNYLYKNGYDGFIYRNEKEVAEAVDLINKSNFLFQQFLMETKSNKFKISDEHKNHPCYIEYQQLNRKIGNTIEYYAQDSIIVFYNNQITIVE